ncbi:uncharacterized protein FFC1_02647 [Fusarium fujikuroi]|nr:uncharacterized protein FFC1_02647 [Fusarium fujikuroi]
MMNTATVVLDLEYVSNDAIPKSAESNHHLEFRLHQLVKSKFSINSNIIGFLRGAPGLRFGATDKESSRRGRSRCPEQQLSSIELIAARLTHYQESVSLIGIPQHTNSIRALKDKPHSHFAIGELASGEGADRPESEYWAS